MFEEILKGTRPSALFRRILENDPSLDKRDLGYSLREHFPLIDSAVVQIIWGWEGPGAIRTGLSDENLDAWILDLLSEAGYIASKK